MGILKSLADIVKVTLCFVLAAGLTVGTIGGIHGNIGYRDWLSVTLWAAFGSAGSVLFLWLFVRSAALSLRADDERHQT